MHVCKTLSCNRDSCCCCLTGDEPAAPANALITGISVSSQRLASGDKQGVPESRTTVAVGSLAIDIDGRSLRPLAAVIAVTMSGRPPVLLGHCHPTPPPPTAAAHMVCAAQPRHCGLPPHQMLRRTICHQRGMTRGCQTLHVLCDTLSSPASGVNVRKSMMCLAGYQRSNEHQAGNADCTPGTDRQQAISNCCQPRCLGSRH